MSSESWPLPWAQLTQFSGAYEARHGAQLDPCVSRTSGHDGIRVGRGNPEQTLLTVRSPRVHNCPRAAGIQLSSTDVRHRN